MNLVAECCLAAALDGFEWRSWGGDAVVYDIESGATHRINAPAEVILGEFVRAGQMRFDELLERCNAAQPAANADLEAVVSILLELGILTEC